MFTKLRLERFKGFKEAELSLGPFTLLVGANASGKSNLRDAFRFLHGVGRGYSLAEILGEKWGEGGELLWHGTRGGTLEAAFHGASSFALELTCAGVPSPSGPQIQYQIEVEPGNHIQPSRVAAERLAFAEGGPFVFASLDNSEAARAPLPPGRFYVKLNLTGTGTDTFPMQPVSSNKPGLSVLASNPLLGGHVYRLTEWMLRELLSTRFFDLDPDVMRRPAFPGQDVLGDRGENLAAVLQAICQDPAQKRTLVSWLQELTPMDATDLEFAPDPIGRIHLMLVEQDGRRTSAYSASDGTLRFLAMLAALFGPAPARFYFIEELENGIHPTRLHLVLELMERIAAERGIQIVATTHSPQLLTLVRPETLEHAALTYRLEGQPDARIRRIVDIPDAKTVLERTDAGHLLATGWLENAVLFAEPVAEAG